MPNRNIHRQRGRSLLVIAIAVCLCAFNTKWARADCGTTLESLGLSGQSLELAQELARLHHEIKSQPKKALQEILESKFNAKVNQLHEAIATQGLAVDKRKLIEAIRQYDPALEPARKGQAETSTELSDLSSTREKRPGSFESRHHPDASRGWDLAATSLKVLDKHKLKDNGAGGSPVVLPDESIVVGSGRYLTRLFLDSTKSHLLDPKSLDVGAAPLTPIVLRDGTLLVGTLGGYLIHVRPEPGGGLSKIDQFEVFFIRAPPTELPDGSFLIAAGGLLGRSGIQVMRVLSNGKFADPRTLWDGVNHYATPVVLADGSVLAEKERYSPSGGRAASLVRFKMGEDGSAQELSHFPLSRQLAAAPMILPNGEIIFGDKDAVVARRGVIYHAKLEGTGEITKLGEVGGDMNGLPAGLSDGTIVVAGEGGLTSFQLDPTKEKSIHAEHSETMQEPQTLTALPNGTFIVTRGAVNSELQLIHATEGGTFERVIGVGPIREAPTILPDGRFVATGTDGIVYLFQVVPKDSEGGSQ